MKWIAGRLKKVAENAHGKRGARRFRFYQNTFRHRDRNFVIFCGIGSNGGDGLVLARLIKSAGPRKVFLTASQKIHRGRQTQL